MRVKDDKTVEPFNDVYTHDCFMNALLCVAKHYQLEYPMLTLQRGFSYFIKAEQLCSHSIPLFPMKDLAFAIGLNVDRKEDCFANWKQQYKTQFEQNGLIIASADDYYNPLRVDVYQKEHLPHYLLICGMDERNQILSVIESKYRTTVFYKNMELMVGDFETSHFSMKTVHTYLCKKHKSFLPEPYKNQYLRCSIDLTEQSIMNLQRYIRFLSKHTITEAKSWLKNLDDICNHVKVEQYVFNRVFRVKDLLDISTEIYQIWYLLRAKIVRIMMIDNSETMASELIPCLDKIADLEIAKFNLLRAHSF